MTIKVYVNKSQFDIKSNIETVYKNNENIINVIIGYIILVYIVPFIAKQIIFG